MATPDFILSLREKIGTELLWLSGVTAVVTDPQDRVLLVRRTDNGEWTPVTGIIDPGEEPAVAAVRETLEEAGIVAVAERLAWVHALKPMVYPNGDRSQYLDIVFRCVSDGGEPFPADGENTEAAWFARDNFPPMSADMRDRVDAALDDPSGAPARFER